MTGRSDGATSASQSRGLIEPGPLLVAKPVAAIECHD